MNYLRPTVILLLVLLTSVAQAAGDPAAKLQRTVNAALDALYGECCKDLSIDDKKAKVRAVLEESYDLEVIIRYSVGRNWRRMKPSEQKEVVELITQLVIKSYVDGLVGKDQPVITFNKTKLNDKRAEVPTIITLDGTDINAIYRMALRENGWQIYDIVVEDISVGKNYRQQFDDHFRRNNAQELIVKLKELLKKEKLDEKVTI